MRSLTDSWELGGLTIPNRVVLAPLAGIDVSSSTDDSGTTRLVLRIGTND